MKRKQTQQKLFQLSKERVKNPYIGFTSYQKFRGDPLNSDIVVDPTKNMTETERLECYPVSPDLDQHGDGQGFHPGTEVAYIRILWKEFEPERGQYNYALIEDILEKAKAHGQTVMFRLMPHSTRESDDVPEWLKSIIECPARPAGKRVKDSPADPLFLQYFGEAIAKIGERFDDDPTLDVVDISLTGAWGEGHKLSSYPQEALEKLMDVYINSFKNTKLVSQVQASDLFQYVSEKRPCGYRADGIGNDQLLLYHYPKAIEKAPSDAWKYAPVSFESFWWLGEWARKDWDIDDIIERTLRWHISTFNAKSLPAPFEWQEKIERWLDKMGYHFALRSFKYPTAADRGDVLKLSFIIENRGVAPIYNSIPLKIRLFNDKKSYVFTTDVDIRKWLPGDNFERIEIALPGDVEYGDYDIEMSVSDDGKPTINFEMQADRNGDYYKIGEITLEDYRAEFKKYLVSFLDEFNYPDDCKALLPEVYDRVFASDDCCQKFESYYRPFEKDRNISYTKFLTVCEEVAALSGENPYTVNLILLIILSKASRKYYAEDGYSEELWHRNFMDLLYKLEECRLVKGVIGNFVPEWYGNFFKVKRFSFGKLQFERHRIMHEYRKGDIYLDPEFKVIHVHIPRTGGRLMPSDVDDACREASELYRQRHPGEPVVFACDSWLLYPENKNILSPTSNLYSFISRFDIIESEDDFNYTDAWRLFDKDYNGNVDELPQDTSLRRAYAERMREGKPLGRGFGVWLYDDIYKK